MSSSAWTTQGQCPFELTYHASLTLNQKAPEPLHDPCQDSPSEAMLYIRRYDMDRSSIAQIVVEGVFGVGKRHIARPSQLFVTVSVVAINLNQSVRGRYLILRWIWLTSWRRRRCHARLLNRRESLCGSSSIFG